MKKLYSKKLGGEAFALDAAQLDTLKKAGYTVPRPEDVIADAAAVKIAELNHSTTSGGGQANGGGRRAGGRRMIKLGDRITVKPATFDVPGKDGKPKAIPGTVVYIHPAGRYCVLEFDVGRREPVTIRESFQLIDGRVAE